MPIELAIDDYGGGYRATASGRVAGRLFAFRLMRDAWFFGVGRKGAASIWWHSDEVELEFEASGPAEPAWHTESLPHLLEGLRRYLDSRGVAADERDQTLALAEDLAQDLFASA